MRLLKRMMVILLALQMVLGQTVMAQGVSGNTNFQQQEIKQKSSAIETKITTDNSTNVTTHSIMQFTPAAFTKEITTGFAGGDGTEENPYLISNKEQLKLLDKYTKDLSTEYYYFELTNDIDLAGEEWTALCYPESYWDGFYGNFNGNGYIIENLTIMGYRKSNQGLFCNVAKESIVETLGVINASINNYHTRGIIASKNFGAIRDCFTSGKVEGYNSVGGIVGSNHGLIVNCYSNATVGSDNGSYIGGISGSNSRTIKDCKFFGTIIAEKNYGGISYKGKISNCVYDKQMAGIQDTTNAEGKTTKELVADGHYPILGEFSTTSQVIAVTPIYLGEENKLSDVKTAIKVPTQVLEERISWQLSGDEGYSDYIGLGEVEAGLRTIDVHTKGLNRPINVNLTATTPYGHEMTYTFVLTPKFYDGEGTEDNPYQIHTPKDLENMKYFFGNTYDYTYFALYQDIDLSEYDSFCIKNQNEKFYGILDGRGHTILNLSSREGLFNKLNQAEISDLILANVNIDGDKCGALANRAEGSKIDQVMVMGNINGKYYAGGLVGEVWYDTFIENCQVSGQVSGDGAVGGIVGFDGLWNVEGISNCYICAQIVGKDNNIGAISGKIFLDYYGKNNIKNCYYDSTLNPNISLLGSGVREEEDEEKAKKTTKELTNGKELTGLSLNYWSYKKGAYPILKYNDVSPLTQKVQALVATPLHVNSFDNIKQNFSLPESDCNGNDLSWHVLEGSPYISIDGINAMITIPSDRSKDIVLQASNDVSSKQITYTLNQGIPVQDVKIEEAERIYQQMGTTRQLEGSVIPADATNPQGKWSSSNEQVVNVDDNGNMQAIKTGKVIVTYRALDGVAKDEVNVEVVNLQINPNPIFLPIEKDKIAEYQLELELPESLVGKTVNWESIDPKIASVSENGIVTGIKIGTTQVKATLNEYSHLSALCEINVIEAKPVSSIDVTPNKIYIKKDSVEKDLRKKLKVQVNYEDGTKNIQTNYKMEGLNTKEIGEQAVKVSYTSLGKTTSKDITVVVEDVQMLKGISPVSNLELEVGTMGRPELKSVQLGYKIEPEQLNKSVKWFSSNEDVVKVNGNGLVTAIGKGTTSLTVRVEDGSETQASCIVNVIQKDAINQINILGPTQVHLGKNQTYQVKVETKPNTHQDQLKWKSSNEAVAKVDETGMVQAVGGGKTSIRVYSEHNPMIKAEVEVIVENLILDKYNLNLYLGDQQNSSTRLNASVDCGDLGHQEAIVNWSSADTRIVQIDVNGNIIPINIGKTTITATAVNNPNVQVTCGVTVEKINFVTAKGETFNGVLGLGENVADSSQKVVLKTIIPVEQIKEWRYVDEESKDIIEFVNNSDGSIFVEAKALGTAKIEIETKNGAVEMLQIDVINLGFEPSFSVTKVNLAFGEDVELGDDQKEVQFLINGQPAQKKVLWKSQDESIATVSAINGGKALIEAKSSGKTMICAIVDGVTLRKNIAVNIQEIKLIYNNEKAKEIKLEIGNKAHEDKKSAKLEYNLFALETGKEVEWVSSNPEIATVDQTGKVVPIGVGTATIIVHLKDGTGTKDSCKVEVIRVHRSNSSSSFKKSTVTQVINRLSDTDKKNIINNFKENVPYTSSNTKLTLKQLKKLTNNKFTDIQLEKMLEKPEMLKQLGIDTSKLNTQVTLKPIKNATFKDVAEKHWANQSIKKAAELGFVAGKPDGTFAPNVSLQMTDTFTFLDRVLVLNGVTDMKLPRSTVEQYITNKDHWAFANMASIASKLKETTLATISKLGDEPFSRELLAQVLYEITDGKLKPVKESVVFKDTGDNPYNEAIDYCVRAGLLNGTSKDTMAPQKPLTRAELMTVLIRLNDVLK